MNARAWLSALVATVLLSSASLAFAAAPLDVIVEGGTPELQRDVRAAIDRELSGVTASGKVTVTITGSTVEVRAAHADGRLLVRTITLPERRDRAAEAVALLAGNLVRDQTSELEDELRRSRTPAAPPPPPPPAVAAVPAAVPMPRVEPFDPCGPRPRSYAAAEVVPDVAFPTGATDPESARWASLSFVGGYKGTTKGFSLSILGTHGSRGVCGAHLAGIWDWAYGPVKGVQIAGVVASAERVSGYQVAPFVRARNSMSGLQTGAVAVAGDVQGAQIAALSWARDTYGLQVGAISFARDVGGLQVGAVSLARDTDGAQIGVFNLARRSKGLQLGVVNIADDADAPVGIVNIIRHGRLHADTWMMDIPGLAVGLVHGGRYTHTIYGVGVRRGADHEARPVFVLGIGGHVPAGERAFVDVDVLTHFVPDKKFEHNANVFQLRVIGGVKVGEGMSVFAGPTINLAQIPPEADEKYGIGGSKTLDWGGGAVWKTWPGATVGLRAF